MALTRRLLCFVLAVLVVAPVAAQTEDAFALLLKDVQAFRSRGFTLPRPEGVPERYAGRMADVSPARYEREAKALEAFAARLDAIDRAVLPRPTQIDADILFRQLRDRREEIRFRAHEVPIGSREGFHFDLPAWPDRSTFTTVAHYDSYIARLQSFRQHTAQQIANMRAGLEAGRTMPRALLLSSGGYDQPVAAQIVEDVKTSPLYGPFARVPALFSEEDRARIQRDGEAALRDSVMPGLGDFLTFLRQEYIPGARTPLGIDAFPDGKAFYQHRIRMHTTLDLTPKQVHDIGLREVARLRAEMEQVQERAGFTGTLADFMKFLQTDPRFRVESEEEYLKAVALAAKRMDGELPKLFINLPRAPYGVRAMPAGVAIRQSAGYYDAGAADGSRAGWMNINTSDITARPLYVVEALAFHEGAPGHHLQIMRVQENTALSAFRRNAGITVFTEGWGLYAEKLGRDVGFYQDPYSDFGRLTYEIWRAVRLVVDSGVHAFGWTREQAIAYMGDNTGFQIGPSTAETDRHITEAGQGLAYTFGLLKIVDLRARAEAKLGSRFDIREFHDVILRNGPLPLDVLEKEVAAWMETR
ncbi:MAG: DUF885 domain-containing protein [Acidobacteriota bacterium]|nr:DUF885 domain-containing protein [Acidobacteriota bacterium]